MKDISKNQESVVLRQKAEELLRQKQSLRTADLSEVDVLTLLHELEVHQIELQIQNEEMQLAKEKAEKSNHLKSAFLANMSHEIRTPMSGILGFAELLKEPGLSGETQQEYIRIIENSGARMLTIINDIIDISKIEAGFVKPNVLQTNINEQIENIYNFFKPEVERKGMKLSFRNTLNSEESFIYTDREKLNAILINLVKNAIKYSDMGSIVFGCTSKLGVFEFYVRDTGIGIPKDRQQAIFDRFIQADLADRNARQGAGLGLSISKAYVEMLGGKIWVDSEPGKGSCFYFTIPSAEKDENTSTATITHCNDEQSKRLPKNIKLLITEDDEACFKYLASILTPYDFNMVRCITGLESVEFCQSNPDIGIILMDLKTPVIDGFEATRRIRKFNKDVVIIAQTAYAISGAREEAINAGCNDYISKPIKKGDLISLIERALGNI